MKNLITIASLCSVLLFSTVAMAEPVHRAYDSALMVKMMDRMSDGDNHILLQLNADAIERGISLEDRVNQASRNYVFMCSSGETDKCSIMEALVRISSRMDTTIRLYMD